MHCTIDSHLPPLTYYASHTTAQPFLIRCQSTLSSSRSNGSTFVAHANKCVTKQIATAPIIDFDPSDWVWVRLQPYKQRSLGRRTHHKPVRTFWTHHTKNPLSARHVSHSKLLLNPMTSSPTRTCPFHNSLTYLLTICTRLLIQPAAMHHV